MIFVKDLIPIVMNSNLWAIKKQLADTGKIFCEKLYLLLQLPGLWQNTIGIKWLSQYVLTCFNEPVTC